MRSETLRHFPETDPIPLSIHPEKVQARADIESAIAEYLARGGQIEQVGSEANRNPEFILGNVIRPKSS